MSLTEIRGTASGRRPAAAARVVGVGVAVLSGGGLAIQSRINGDLGKRLDDGIAAAVVSFAVGVLILLALVPATPAGRRSLGALRQALRTRSLRPWQCLGGVCGALLVASQGLTVSALGVAIFSVAVVAGQSASSLAVDRAGLAPTGRQRVTPARLVGAALAVVAVVLAVGHQLGTPSRLVLAVLPALAGIGVAFQQAVNGRVRVASGSAPTAALVNFLTGAAVLLVAYALDVAVRGWPAGSWPGEAWLYLGGPIGVVIIAVATAVVRLTGVLLLGLATIAGQITGAVAIDICVPPAGGRPGLYTLLGALLTLVAVGFAVKAPAPEAPAH